MPMLQHLVKCGRVLEKDLKISLRSHLGTGVGGGVIVNGGDIVHGSKGAAGEVGHITAVPNGGFMCNCGKAGCLETVASATGVVRTAQEKLANYQGES